jgi:hypothetical protein
MGAGFVRDDMKKTLLCILIMVCAVGLSGCDAGEEPTQQPDMTSVPTMPSDAGDGRVITGEEALALYGIDVNNPPTPDIALATPQTWFPAKAWVEPSVLPYDPDETIDFLPMYTTTGLGNLGLNEPGMWLGDLISGQKVILYGITQDGKVCLVEGPVMQGWEAKGWVSCNRLSYTEPEG